MLSKLTTEQLQAAFNVFQSSPHGTPREILNEKLHQSRDWLIAKEAAGNGPELLAMAIHNELILRAILTRE